MSKIRSEIELQDAIEDEYAWRFYEIVSLKSILQNNTVFRFTPALVRSLVVVAYAHWEGFVKDSTSKFLEYISFLGLGKNDMSLGFLAASIYHLISEPNMNVERGVGRIMDYLNNPVYTFSHKTEMLTNAESNLSSKVLKKISLNIGLDISSLDIKMTELDAKVLKRRNDMAHGDKDMIDVDYGVEVAAEVIELMRDYKGLLQDMIAKRSYRI